MSSTKKTIKINPELFKMTPSKNTGNRAKTSKNRGGSQSIVKPNKIKRKLLERIKEHSRANNVGNNNVTSEVHAQEGANKYAEEFYESMNYLSNLANETNASSPYKHPPKQTRKRPPSISSDNMHVNIELPDDLKEHAIGQIESGPTITLNNVSYSSVNPPYGCLKGGQKPTYRTWNKSHRSYEAIVPPIVSMPSPATNTPHATTNENRLAKLKEVFRQKREVLQKPPPVDLPRPSNISIPLSINTQESSQTYPDAVVDKSSSITSIDNTLSSTPEPLKVGDLDTEFAINSSIPISDTDSATMVLTPKKTKKTTTRKYRIGKDAKRRVVGVLIKDRQTRKKILDAQRSIRRTHISDMKKYLHMHGLMRAGSHAPNDIIRKMYESSVMSGDIFNNDNEILAHNFSQEM